jgi:uncharacterized protein (TIGR04255 family)
MSYKNPLIQEMYCEFFFDKLLANNEQQALVDFFREGFVDLETDPIVGTAGKLALRYRLWNKDKTELLQFFNNRFSFNVIPKEGYNGWNDFKTKSLEFQEKVNEVIPTNKWKRVALCYVDGLNVKEDDKFSIGKYLNCSGPILPEYLKNSNVATDLLIGKGDIEKELNHQIKIKINKTDKINYNIRIETLVSRLIDNKKFDSILILEENHKECIELFEGIFTEFTKNNVMGGTV